MTLRRSKTMDIETVDEYRAKWAAVRIRVGTPEEKSAWEMYALAVNIFEATTGLDYEKPERRKAETPNDT
jgi:hypothetical protein